MNIHPMIFVSYNPGVELEQSTALRLQTIASLYNSTVLLPDRTGNGPLNDSTKDRILRSQVFILFSNHILTSAVKQEAEFALLNSKKVIIFYNKHIGKKVSIKNASKENFLEVAYDPFVNNPADLLGFVFEHGGFLRNVDKPVKNQQNENNAIGALIGVGLGLLLLWKLSNPDDDKPKKKNRR